VHVVCVQWKEAQQSQLMDSKLKCVFEMSADGAKVRSSDSVHFRLLTLCD